MAGGFPTLFAAAFQNVTPASNGGAPVAAYASPNGFAAFSSTSLDSLFSDDFGGSAVNASNWTVIDGGLGANPNLGNGTLTQGAIGSGITGVTDSVAASGLTVSMNTTLGAERWYLSNQVFGGKEDILVILSRSQALTANSCFIGLCEVDPVTLVPLLNPNFAADGNGSGEFTNRAGCEFGLTVTTTAYQAETIGDSSAAKAIGVTGVAASAMTTTQEYLIEIDSRDTIVSSAAVDSVAAKAPGASRVSSQNANDKKLYKLVMRFKNVTAPGSNTSFVIQRILVSDNYEIRTQISTAEGDSIGAKALGVNLLGTPAVGTTMGAVVLNAQTNIGPATYHTLISAATTNATLVKGSSGNVSGGIITNTVATTRFLKLYNKATAPVPGTDVPIFNIPLAQNVNFSLGDFGGAYGCRFNLGIGYAITASQASNDATAIAAGDVQVNILYT
jgi:hypothetical protein